MMAEGRGRWAVSQEPKLILVNSNVVPSNMAVP